VSTTVVAAVVAAVALISGAGAVDGGRGADTAPSGRTSVSSTDDHVVRPMTTVWRPR